MPSFQDELALLLPSAYRLALGMLLDPHLAEDMVQEAALDAWRKQGQRRPQSDLRPWFLAIVANRCRGARRSRWSRVLLMSAPPEPAAFGGDSNLDLAVRRALLAVAPTKRLALVLRFYLDLPFDQVATTMGCSENAAKLRVGRAILELRRHLEDVYG